MLSRTVMQSGQSFEALLRISDGWVSTDPMAAMEGLQSRPKVAFLSPLRKTRNLHRTTLMDSFADPINVSPERNHRH